MADNNLWGDFAFDGEPQSPIVILKEQASMLGNLTNNVVEARVSSQTGDLKTKRLFRERYLDPPSEDLIHVAFDLVVPALEFYTVGLLTVAHPIKGYPLTIFQHSGPDGEPVFTCHDDRELINDLRAILSSGWVHSLVRSLYLQARNAPSL